MSKAFKPFNNSAGTSSERTSNLRREVMYTAVTKSQAANKLNQYQSTNRNFRLTSCSDTNGNNVSTMVSAADYKTYMDLAIGKRVVNPVLNGVEAYSLDGRMGAFYRLNVGKGAVIATTDASNGSAPLPDVAGGSGMIAWPNSSQGDVPTGATDQYISSANDNYKGFVLDPYSRRTEKCTIDTTARKSTVISPLLDIDARWLNAYWQATGGQPLAGFSFPAKVNFGTQQTNYDNDIVVNAAPMTKATNVNDLSPSTAESSGAFDNAESRYCGPD